MAVEEFVISWSQIAIMLEIAGGVGAGIAALYHLLKKRFTAIISDPETGLVGEVRRATAQTNDRLDSSVKRLDKKIEQSKRETCKDIKGVKTDLREVTSTVKKHDEWSKRVYSKNVGDISGIKTRIGHLERKR